MRDARETIRKTWKNGIREMKMKNLYSDLESDFFFFFMSLVQR